MKKQQIFLFVLFQVFTASFFYNCSNFNLLQNRTGQHINNPDQFPNIQVYFTNPPHEPEFEALLIKQIDSLSGDASVDMAIYGLDRNSIITALENAINRGVYFRFVGNLSGTNPIHQADGDYYSSYLRIARALDQKHPISGKKRINFPDDSGFDDFILVNNSGIMHNKFLLIKDGSSDLLVTGSANFTETGFSRNNNNILFITDRQIVETFQQQFNYLLNIPGARPVVKPVNHIIDGIKVTVIFSSCRESGKTSIEYIQDFVLSARQTISFMIFTFPHQVLLDSLIQKNESGVAVCGIFDLANLMVSQEENLIKNGIPCKVDGNYHVDESGTHGGKLHHKVMIIDQLLASATVITGSLNWSRSGEINNNETTIIIHSKEIAEIFGHEWELRWQEATTLSMDQGDTAEYQDIIINEVMWMGAGIDLHTQNVNDEFIELKNISNKTINIAGWKISGKAIKSNLYIKENYYINPGQYVTLMALPQNKSIFDPAQYITCEDLSISNQQIHLLLQDCNDETIDTSGTGTSFISGGYNGIIKKSIARKQQPGNGADSDNWFTTNTQCNIKDQHDYKMFNCATPGAVNFDSSIQIEKKQLILSEIAWAGSDVNSSDEWFELFNNSNMTINLAGWMITGDLTIHLYGTISPYGYYLLERTDQSSVPDQTADIIYTGSLLNAGGSLNLTYNYNNIDLVSCSPWYAGTTNPKISMERILTNLDASRDSWQNGIGDIEGAKK